MRTLLIAGLAALTLSTAACDKKGPAEAPAAKVTWPAAPSDGTPVVLQFKELVDEKGEKLARMTMFNYADKGVSELRMTLHYLDASGKELKTFPWGQSKRPELTGAKGTVELPKLGAFLPPETASVTATIESVGYTDGTKWEMKQ